MSNKGPLKLEIPSQGWNQFLTARKEMLDSFDKARIQSRKHKVETYHGSVAEAEIRKWLNKFLPKKYSVTSGYIISQGISDEVKAPHFDVIIYEHLESPILWIEDSPDSSEQGRSLAIPAEYVKSVLEVKSAFKNKAVVDALEHLGELNELMSNIDEPNEIYKKYLPADFFCGTIFFELRKENEFDKLALNNLIKGIYLRGFFGGIILRGEGYSKPYTARIELLKSKTELKSMISKPDRSMLKRFCDADSLKINDQLHIGAMMNWLEPNFSRFAFDLVARLNGTFKVDSLSSFHTFGTSK